jgi:hypothetical protein
MTPPARWRFFFAHTRCRGLRVIVRRYARDWINPFDEMPDIVDYPRTFFDK